jgi:hypothetical protein
MLVTPPHLEPWHPGSYGKGFRMSGQWYAWAVNGVDGVPPHDEAYYNVTRPVHNLHTQDEMYDDPFYISPDGEVAFYHHITDDPMAVARQLIEHDDRLHHTNTNAWSDTGGYGWEYEITSAAKLPPFPDYEHVEHHLSPESTQKVWELVNEGWQPGKEGKGLFVNGELYTWATVDDDGWPHHSDVYPLLTQGGNYNIAPAEVGALYYIGTDGEIDGDEQTVAIAPQHDPRLFDMGAEGFDLTAHKLADDGGGEAPGVAETGAYLGYPLWGIWGMASTRWQKHHRRKKRKKKRKKKSDFWEDQRRQDFPEDFEETELEATKPRPYDEWEIRQLVNEAELNPVELGQEGKALLFPNGNRIEWRTDAHGGPHHDEVRSVYRLYDPDDADNIVIARDGTETNYSELWRKGMDEEFGMGGEEEWHFGKTADAHDFPPDQYDPTFDYHHYRPGQPGKAFIAPDGRLVSWNVGGYGEAPEQFFRDAGPHHAEVAMHIGLDRFPEQSEEALADDRQDAIDNEYEFEEPEPSWHTPISIDTQGQYDVLNWNDNWRKDMAHSVFQAAGLRPKADNEWHFGALQPNEEGHVLNWEEGWTGKGLLLADGTLHTWNDDDYEYHNDYAIENIGVGPGLEDTLGGAHYLYISPQGKVSTSWGTLGAQEEERLREADPRLYVDIDEGGSAPWQFGAAAE